MSLNLNDLAKEVSTEEGLTKQVNIAQIKEIIGALGRVFRRRGTWGTVLLALKIRNTGK